jgi:hypothetical protein
MHGKQFTPIFQNWKTTEGLTHIRKTDEARFFLEPRKRFSRSAAA